MLAVRGCRLEWFESLGVVHIQSLSIEDEGIYQCVAESTSARRVSEPARLRVIHSDQHGLCIMIY